ncbi:MAG: CAP domain-containing protein [Phaeodactylibacter sp.]|nr:CAP domain-containing protein [Phaeodactylibacter sp.]MCB9264728.1 CAP domain-containing protein [Lewinellaceae bacterium]MCB9287776.1 CAP domain-containing protein [Lewinellaceae bacterium]
MKTMIQAFLIALAVFACSKPGMEPTPEEPEVINEAPSLASQMLDEVNALRESGCRCGSQWMPPAPPLSWNNQLASAARRHAGDMNRNGFFNHRGSDGSTMSQRATEAGYSWRAIAENIAWGHPDVSAVVRGWKDSPGHCENMMSREYEEMGAAKAGLYWVQDLGKQ